MKAYTFATDGSGKMTEGAVPADMTDKVNAAREALVEMVAEADDSLMEKFFEAGTLSQEDLLKGLHTGVASRKIFPLVCTSATLNIGVQPLLDAVLAYLPAASERTVKAIDKAGAETSFQVSESGPTAVFVWKTIADPFAGRISLFRVMRGAIRSDSTIANLSKDASERLGHLLLLQGKTQTEVAEIKAGDLGAVAKLKDTQTGHTLGDKDGARFPPPTFAEPVLSYAIEPVAAGLLLVPAVGLGRRRDGLEVRDARQLEVDLDAEAALQLGDGHLDVHLALAGEQQFVGLRVAAVADRRVFLDDAVQRRADLLLVAAGLGLDGVREHRLGERRRREARRRPSSPERVAGLRVLQLGDRAEVAGLDLGDLRLRLALQQQEVAQPLARRPSIRLRDGRVGP